MRNQLAKPKIYMLDIEIQKGTSAIIMANRKFES